MTMQKLATDGALPAAGAAGWAALPPHEADAFQGPVQPVSPPDSFVNLLNFSRAELVEWMGLQGVPPKFAASVWRRIYGKHPAKPANAEPQSTPPSVPTPTPTQSLPLLPPPLSGETLQDALPPQVAARIAAPWGIRLPEIVSEQRSEDGFTRKFLLRLADGARIETVLMRHEGRNTVCLSSQVGCAMGCVFCATGALGFTRHLTTAEIVGQALIARAAIVPLPPTDARTAANGTPTGGLRNAVFMGMGEPLANYAAVMRAVEILCDSGGLALRRERVSVSTVGVVPEILRLAAGLHPPALAVSLHAATQEERAAIVPVARRWPLDALLGTCREYSRATRRKVFFEWTLIQGRNDSPETAHRLAALLHGMDAHVNLIFLNPIPAKNAANAPANTNASTPAKMATPVRLAPSDTPAATRFQSILRAAGIPATFRASRGPDILAACGQLSAAT